MCCSVHPSLPHHHPATFSFSSLGFTSSKKLSLAAKPKLSSPSVSRAALIMVCIPRQGNFLVVLALCFSKYVPWNNYIRITQEPLKMQMPEPHSMLPKASLEGDSSENKHILNVLLPNSSNIHKCSDSGTKQCYIPRAAQKQKWQNPLETY